MRKRIGVADGDRTRDNRNHNPGLYQLSYGHHIVLCEHITPEEEWHARQGLNLQPSA